MSGSSLAQGILWEMRTVSWVVIMMRRLFFVLSVSLAALTVLAAKERPNVLLICVDDLRPELGCYGVDYIQSPNIDALAKRGVLFESHYVQAPTCGASRYAMLTGQYGPRGNDALFARAGQLGKGGKDEVVPSLPAWFREKGYTTVSVGKVSHHPGGRGGADWDNDALLEMPNSWDRHLLPAGPWQHPRGWMHGLANGKIREEGKRMDLLQAQEGDDSIYPDGVMIPVAIEQLQVLAKEEKPFFLAVGVLRPHLPFGAPKKYLDLYEGVELPSIPHPGKPKGKTTWHRSGEFMKYNRWGRNPNEDDDFADEVRRHYAACVSYADAMVGQVLEALEESGKVEETIVILWGDHGWHLGEHAVWGKHTLFEESLRSPLIVVPPDLRDWNQRTGAIVQSVDIFPTLCDLAGLETPASLDGRSLAHFAIDAETKKSRGFAFAYHGNKRTIKTSSARLVQHENGYSELYISESKTGESKNLAESHPKMVEALKAKLDGLK